ncbi:hypothetical protein [Chitinivibrio alkaliphilus]|uniref:Uncharacterized protein n=1 Tax=Chitinivibrio alkaliphilus ACht1 TaxID=1313304 RepID=U7D9T3_9BACT|nr:hypothetical protein [Chitinivibrio alkaliphilus]ERP31842.1 hypothetical protein CALK_1291 [Chitinivibrio alkaliphilus ACht1]
MIQNRFWILLCVLLTYSCSLDIAGATSETTNGAVAIVDTGPGGMQPAAHASVYIRPAQAPHDTEVLQLHTDRNGLVRIDTALTPGPYLCEFVYEDTLMAVTQLYVTSSNIIDITDSLTLHKGGVLQGDIALPEAVEEATVSLPGLGRKTSLDSSGAFTFPHIPQGEVTLRYRVASATHTQVHEKNTTIMSGDTTHTPTFTPLEKDLEQVWRFMERNYMEPNTEKLWNHIDTTNNRVSHMYFDRAGIHYLTSEIFSLPLRHLSMAHNYITEIPGEIQQLNKLTHLDFSRNNIREVPAEIASLNRCRKIDLSMNEIEDLPARMLEDNTLRSLDYIYLAHNYLVNLAQDAAFNDWLKKFSYEAWAEDQYSR